MSVDDPARHTRNAAPPRGRPRPAAAFAVLAVAAVLVGIAGAALRADLTASRLPDSATPEARDAVRSMLLDELPVRSLFLPVRLFAGLSLFSLVLLWCSRTWRVGARVRFGQVFPAAILSESALLAGSAASIAAAWTSPPAAVGPAGVPWIPLGLDLVVPAGDFVARYALNSVNVFSAAHLALLTVLLSGATGLPRGKAAISAIGAWAIGVGANAAILHALRAEFHLLL